MPSAIWQTLEAGSVRFDSRKDLLPSLRAPDHHHWHGTPRHRVCNAENCSRNGAVSCRGCCARSSRMATLPMPAPRMGNRDRYGAQQPPAGGSCWVRSTSRRQQGRSGIGLLKEHWQVCIPPESAFIPHLCCKNSTILRADRCELKPIAVS